MRNDKIIGYYGNGAPKYASDEDNYARRGYSPSYNPNPFNRTDFARSNNNTYRQNNGAYPDRLYR